MPIADLVTTEGGTGKELKKSVEYVHVGGSLSLIERKIINVLLLYAYDDLMEQEEHTISIALLCRSIGWETSRNHAELKDALRAIRRIELEFDYFNRKTKARDADWTHTNPVGEVTLTGGVCTYSYGPKLRAKLKDPKMYALINMHMQRKFQSTYGLALYENTIRYKDTGSTGWHPVDDWKGIFGVIKYDKDGSPIKSAYDSFKVFNARVIKVAVEDVNAHSTEYQVEAEYDRAGREVKRIRFRITPKQQPDMFAQVDEKALPNSPGWKALEAIGCRPTFIRNTLESRGEEWALDVAEECRSATTPPALAKWFDKSGTEPAKRKNKRAALTVAPQATAADQQASATRGAWGRLTDAEKEAVTLEFMAADGATQRIEGKYDFRDLNEKSRWMGYRGKRAAEVIANRG